MIRFAMLSHLFSEAHDTREDCARVKMRGFERAAPGGPAGAVENTERREPG